mmetsp:Transcript_21882/g.39713  ORF Transcript_21882/g.39713 Transcript_21882/m.39713 type:complete len:201 (+) Transcript_21882:332-934(+)
MRSVQHKSQHRRLSTDILQHLSHSVQNSAEKTMMLKQALQVALLLTVSPVVSAFLPPLAVGEIATKSACPYSANFEEVRKFALFSRTEAADDTADSIKDAADDAADSVKSAVDDSKDTIDDIRDDVGEKIKTEETTWEKTKEVADDIKDSMKDKAESAKDAVKDAAGSVKDTVKDAAGTVKEKAVDAKDKVADKLSGEED